MIAAGSTLTLDVQGTVGEWLPRTADEVRGAVLGVLGGSFTVHDVQIERATFLSDPENLYYWAWGYKAIVTLTTREGYGDAADVGAIVANAFYQAGGVVPTVTVRGSGPQQGPATSYVGVDLSMTLVLAGLALLAVAFAVYGPHR